jgi:hypothetical protein
MACPSWSKTADCCHQTQADVLQWGGGEEKRENTNHNLLPGMGTKSDPKITIPTKKKVERERSSLSLYRPLRLLLLPAPE